MPKKILIADDEPDIARLIASRLKAHNYDVTIASDGLYAVSKAHKEKPDLIILDIKMPAGGGLGVYESLKKATDTMMIPVIFVTGFADEQTRKKILDMGAVDVVAKPFDSKELVAKVKKALGEE